LADVGDTTGDGTVPKVRERIVSETRGYTVLTVSDAKQSATSWLKDQQLDEAIDFGLPEIDDRYHIWRVPVLRKGDHAPVGEIVVDAYTSLIDSEKGTSSEVIEARLLGRRDENNSQPKRPTVLPTQLRNSIALGDAEEILQDLPAESVGLVFTSPPYFNARPEYSEYFEYEDYLTKLRNIIKAAHRVLSEGRFFVINVSPVLVRRRSRSESSKRIAVPFDLHRIFTEEGFDFIDDIIWLKPEGAGWATGRGRRFAADRNPLQYKSVPVTEYVLVYRKSTDKLIDWNIRHHSDQDAVAKSKIEDGYERTNVWRITPSHSKSHPAIFPTELADKVIRYYSFVGDIVLDPFAGSGTTGKAAVMADRKFFLIDVEPKYVDHMRNDVLDWLGTAASEVFTINCGRIETEKRLM